MKEIDDDINSIKFIYKNLKNIITLRNRKKIKYKYRKK